MPNVIEVSNLKKTYDLPRKDRKAGVTTFEAVKGTNFSVEKGEIFGILGPNGAGKTTTLEIMEGLKEDAISDTPPKFEGRNYATIVRPIKKTLKVEESPKP